VLNNGPYHASTVDPDTGNTISVASQPDGTVTITVTDPGGHVTVRTKDRPSLEQTRRDLDAARHSLDELKAKLKDAIDRLNKCREGEEQEREEEDEEVCAPPQAAVETLSLAMVSVDIGEIIAKVQGLGLKRATISIRPNAKLVHLDATEPVWPNLLRSLFGWIAPQPVYAATIDKADLHGLRVALVATGQSQGRAIELRVLNPPDRAMSITIPDGLVLEPLKDPLVAPKALASASVPAEALIGYCVNFAKLPPVAGQQYRIGEASVQKEYAPAARVIRAADKLSKEGLLHADTERTAYENSITQLAIWAHLEHWTPDQLRVHFLELVRKNIESSGHKWTSDIEKQAQQLVPGRLRDVAAVQAEAVRLAAGNRTKN
jgi:hypothetical protein